MRHLWGLGLMIMIGWMFFPQKIDAASGSFRLEPATSAINLGEQLTLKLLMTTDVEVQSATIKIFYPRQLLANPQLNATAIFSWNDSINNNDGYIAINFANQAAGISESGLEIMQITFDTILQGSAAVTIDSTSQIFTDAYLQDAITTTVASGNYQILYTNPGDTNYPPTATPTSELLPKSGTTAATNWLILVIFGCILFGMLLL